MVKGSAVPYTESVIVPIQPPKHQAEHTLSAQELAGSDDLPFWCCCACHQITIRIRVSSYGATCVRFCVRIRGAVEGGGKVKKEEVKEAPDGGGDSIRACQWIW